MAIICDRCGREMNDRWEIEGMPGDGGNCSLCGDDLCAECAGEWDDDGECQKCQEDRMKAENEKRLAALEERVSLLEERLGVSPATKKNVVEIDLTLPEENIDGLYFNKQKVRAVFERGKNGAYYSRDILFLSARNIHDDNNVDLLTEYLNSTRRANRGSIKGQIANALGIEDANTVEMFLPEKPMGMKQYHSVNCWYWLRPCRFGSAANFCFVSYSGNAYDHYASALGGCAPAFRIRRR